MSNSSASKSFKQRMRDAKLPVRTVRINTASALAEEHAALNSELDDLLSAQPASSAQRLTAKTQTPPEVLALTEQIEALEAAMEDSWETFTLEGKPFNVWRDFKIDHPPTDAKDDQFFGVNMGAVVTDFLRGCIVSPDIDDETWKAMLNGGIWPGDLQILAANVVGLHESQFSVPKSRLVSAVRATFAEQQEQLAASASPSAGSTAGSQSSGTSTTRLTGP